MEGTTNADEKTQKLQQQIVQSETDKRVLQYERDLYLEKIEDMRLLLLEADRLMKAKHRDLEVTRSKLIDVERERDAMSVALRDREAVIQKAGLVLYGAEASPSGDNSKNNEISLLLLSPEVVSTLERIDGASLDEKLKFWLNETQDLRAKVKKYREDFSYFVQQSASSSNDSTDNANKKSGGSESYDSLAELQKETSRQLSDAKVNLLKLQEERNSLEQQSTRFEQQATRYKQQLSEMETENESLKQDRRRLQKDIRDKDAQISELEYNMQERTRQLEKLQKKK